MIRLTTRGDLGAWRQGQGTEDVGLVPTMGALHEGHLSLVRRSVEENQATVASVFVNPAQFDAAGDLASYPRDLANDAELLASCGCDALYAPSPEVIYPPGFQTWVEVGEVAKPLEGAARPGHFRGVATVVLKLLHQARPRRAYFGEKDFQQLVVVRTLVRDLDLPVEIVACPTVREPDGLAMSSRNRRLAPRQRAAAAALYSALRRAAEAHAGGERDPRALRSLVTERLSGEPAIAVEYVSAADPATLRELVAGAAPPAVLLSLAARVGEVRLIDNILLAERAEEVAKCAERS